jgi:hypothetical protein
VNPAAFHRSTISLGADVVILAYRHDFGIDDLRGEVVECGERFATVELDPDANPRGLGIVSLDVAYDRLELVVEQEARS